MRRDVERLEDILEALQRIRQHTSDGREPFDRQELVQVWVIHHLEIVGEACRALSPSLRERHPEVPWSDITGMRNILVHDYFGLDLDEVWSAVDHDLPVLRGQIEAILAEERSRS